MNKYELTDETKTLGDGTVLHRIRSVRDFKLASGYKIRAGKLGGWIENEPNLSHDGKAWVSDEACVYGSAMVYSNAHVMGWAEVYGNACVCDNAQVFGDARIDGAATVCGDAWVSGRASVRGYARVCDAASVYGQSLVYDSAHISGRAEVHGDAVVCDDAKVYGNARVCDNACVCDTAEIYGDALVSGRAKVCGDAKVRSTSDYAVYKNTWSSGRWFTYTRSNGIWKVGCFHGTGKELIDKAYKDSDRSGRCYETIVRAQEALDRETVGGETT